MRRNFTALVTLSLITVSAPLYAKAAEELPQVMHEFYGKLLELKPFISSYDAFQNPNNKKKIQLVLKEFENKVSASDLKELKVPGFDVTYLMLSRHLRDTSYLFEKEIYNTAWSNLRATTQFCIACHDRLPKQVQNQLWSPLEVKGLSTEKILEEADFLTIGHQFDRSLSLYNQVIRGYQETSETAVGNDQLETAFKRKIAFYARIHRSPTEALKSLDEDLKNEKLPFQTKKNIETWQYSFRTWLKEGKSSPEKLSDQALIAYAGDLVDKNIGGRKITIDDPATVNLLRVSGLLYERIFQMKNSKWLPDMLYLLGKAERDLMPIRTYSLSDTYFRECVLRDPKNPVAQKCFAEYEVSIKQRYRNGATEYVEAGLESMKKKMAAPASPKR